MANNESFIEEVTEAVRRDRLFGLFRRYGWIGVAGILALVGGSAYVEWQGSRAEARAEGFGDAVLTALEAETAADRRAALEAVPADGRQTAIRALLLASDPGEDKAATLAALDGVIADGTLPALYRDVATLRRVVVAGADIDIEARRAALQPLTVPGNPFRVLAAEQLAYLDIESGATGDAIDGLLRLLEDAEASQALKQRAGEIIVALGGELPAAAPAAETPADETEE